MKVHITNLYGQSPQSVALISQNMVANLAKQLDMKEIGIYFFQADGESASDLAIRFDGMNAAVGNEDVVIFQYPSWNGLEFDRQYLERLNIYAGVKKVIFVHDVPPLMFPSNFYLMDKTIEVLNLADVLILPSKKMLDLLSEYGLRVKRILFQNMWDYPTTAMVQRPQFGKRLQFAGNPERFPFVKEWTGFIPLYLYSSQLLPQKENVYQCGWKFQDELVMSLNQTGGFGLVWLQGENADYYTRNVSYKLSTYLAAGLPVIVPRDLSNAATIEQEGLGFVVDSLEEAQKRLKAVTEADYAAMVARVSHYRELIVNGWFTKKLLVDAVFAAYH